MRYLITLLFLACSFYAKAQPNMLYEINDLVPPKLLDPKFIFDDTTKKKMFLFVSAIGESFDYYDDLKTEGNNFNLSVWSNNVLYFKNFQFNIKATYFPVDNNYGFFTEEGLRIDNNYDKLRAGSVLQSEFRPKFQAGYIPTFENTFARYDVRMQASWTPVINSKGTTNEYEFALGIKGHQKQEKNADLRMNTFGQYYLTINPDYKIFSYGYFATATIIHFEDLRLSLNYVFNYNRYNRNGIDKNGFIYFGISTELDFIAKSKAYLLLAYSYDYHYNYRLFHLGTYVQLPIVRRFFIR